VTEPIAPLFNDLIFDFSTVGDNDLAPSRDWPPGGSGISEMFQRWNQVRQILSLVAVSDPNEEVRHRAGGIERVLTLHARMAQPWITVRGVECQ
jgi:hypothetical protein